jgi:predicted amidohydrolase
LPEYHLTSWCPDSAKWIQSCKDSISYLPRYQALAKELNISIVPGTICAVEGEEFRNMAYFLAAGSGEVLASYQKVNLWHPERPHLTAGRVAPLHEAFDTPLRHADGRPVRAGMLICWDLAFPEAFRQLVAGGADLVLIPSWWFPSDADDFARAHNRDSERVFLDSVTVARACEGCVAVVFCNAGGCSQLAMPILGSRGRMADGVVGMSVVEVDLEVLAVAEGNYKVREDMRRDDWHYGADARPRS